VKFFYFIRQKKSHNQKKIRGIHNSETITQIIIVLALPWYSELKEQFGAISSAVELQKNLPVQVVS
jgi:hypothetical protein